MAALRHPSSGHAQLIRKIFPDGNTKMSDPPVADFAVEVLEAEACGARLSVLAVDAVFPVLAVATLDRTKVARRG